jgi:hypothetical protein
MGTPSQCQNIGRRGPHKKMPLVVIVLGVAGDATPIATNAAGQLHLNGERRALVTAVEE